MVPKRTYFLRESIYEDAMAEKEQSSSEEGIKLFYAGYK
jgi:sRNA-binding carbon storage regulator CsrA